MNLNLKPIQNGEHQRCVCFDFCTSLVKIVDSMPKLKTMHNGYSLILFTYRKKCSN